MSPGHEERSAARLAALQALYQLEMTGTAPDDVIEEFIEHRFGAEGEGPRHDVEFFGDIVRGVLRHEAQERQRIINLPAPHHVDHQPHFAR